LGEFRPKPTPEDQKHLEHVGGFGVKYVSSGDFWRVKSKFDQNLAKYFRSDIKIISKEGIKIH
jgi:uncharacterized protein (DUF2249 family)